MTKFKPLLRANMQRTAICIAFILVSHVTKAQVWKRPGDNMLLNVTALKENCELSANGGAQWRGAASCLEWLSNDDDQILVASSDELRGTVNLQRPLLLHTVWNGHLDNPKFMLFVQSFLFTQLRKAPSQRAELWVWRTQGVNNSLPSLNGGLDIPYTHPSLAALPYTLQCKHGLKFKYWHAGKVLSGLPQELWPRHALPWLTRTPQQQREAHLQAEMDRWQHDPPGFTSFTDMQRLVLLAVYGGVSLEVDVLMLRDLRPLQLGGAWWYRWHTSRQIITPVMWGARGDSVLRGVVRTAMHLAICPEGDDLGPPRFRSWTYTELWSKLYQHKRPPLDVLPWAPFNAIWPEHIASKLEDQQSNSVLPTWASFHDTPDPSAAPNNTGSFLRGAFTYHWHHRFRDEFVGGTWGAAWAQRVADYMVGKVANHYGEWWDGSLC